MNLEDLRKLLLAKPAAMEDYPFGPETMVIRVKKKMFALAGIDEEPVRVNLKCDPDDAQVLRSMYQSIQPGYHMNKEHWNTVELDGDVPEDVLVRLIDDSYRLVVKGLNWKTREELSRLKG